MSRLNKLAYDLAKDILKVVDYKREPFDFTPEMIDQMSDCATRYMRKIKKPFTYDELFEDPRAALLLQSTAYFRFSQRVFLDTTGDQRKNAAKYLQDAVNEVLEYSLRFVEEQEKDTCVHE